MDPILVSAGGVGLLAGILAYGWMLSKVSADRKKPHSPTGDATSYASDWPLASAEMEAAEPDEPPIRGPVARAESAIDAERPFSFGEVVVHERSGHHETHGPETHAHGAAPAAETTEQEDEVTPEDIRSIVTQVAAELKPLFDSQITAQATLQESLHESLQETFASHQAAFLDGQAASREALQEVFDNHTSAVLQGQIAAREDLQEVLTNQAEVAQQNQIAAQEGLTSQTAAILEEQRAAQESMAETLATRMAAILDTQLAAQQALTNQMAAILDSQIAVQEALQHQAAAMSESQVAVQEALRDQTSVIADSQMAAQDALQAQSEAIIERLEKIVTQVSQISIVAASGGGPVSNGSGALVGVRSGLPVETVVMRRKFRFTDLNDELICELGELPPGERLSLGSDPASDISIDHEAVAEHHADVYCDGTGKLRIRLKATSDAEGNSVTLRVNNVSLPAAGEGQILSDGDKLLLGRESANDPEWAPRKALLFSATETAADKRHRAPRAASKPGRWT